VRASAAASAEAFTPVPVRPTGPTMARHRSKQEVETPPDLMRAIAKRFAAPDWDLACSVDLGSGTTNMKADKGFDLACNSLKQDWTTCDGTLFLNPPFAKIGPWARKCRESAAATHRFDRILMLVPASVGSNWFADDVHGHAFVHALVGRVRFVTHKAGFPKDLILAEYGRFTGFDCWRWKVDAR
jgi:hypothetical protein